jgi:hypothetical protein
MWCWSLGNLDLTMWALVIWQSGFGNLVDLTMWGFGH